MDDLKSDVKIIRESQIRMEGDVRHHISRTDKLQKMTEPMYKAYTAVKWLIGALLIGVTLMRGFGLL